MPFLFFIIFFIATNVTNLAKRAELVTNQRVSRVTITIDADKCGWVFGCAFDSEVSTRHIDCAIAFNTLDATTGCAATAVPRNKITNA